MELRGKGAVVTGGGRGIGEAVAVALAGAGASVVVSARSQDEIEGVARSLTAAGHQAWAVACDVSDPAQVELLHRTVAERLGGATILVNNAGIASSAPLKAIRLEEWNRLLAVNATGTFLCTQAFMPGMLDTGWGRVINIASVAGRVGAPYISAYCASKHAVVGFTRAVAAEVASRGVTVNAICPGYVDTAMSDHTVETISGKTGMPEAQARRYLEGLSPQQRLMEPQEIAHLVVSLCSSQAGGVNGQAIVLDGGAVQS